MRYEKIDGLRGLTLISMIAYHTCWDLVYLFGVNMPWYRGQAGFLWQQSICWSFFLISGFCVGLGTHPIRRGLVVSLAGLAVTVATLLFMPDDRIVFGTLTFLGCAMVLVGLVRRWLEKVSCVAGMVLAFLLFLIWYPVNRGYLQVLSCSVGSGHLQFALHSFDLPEDWYHGLPMTFLGFMEKGFFSTDYFSLLPWVFLFLAGFFGYRVMERYRELSVLRKGWIAPVEWMGRHSLGIYLVHQPVVFGVLWVAAKFVVVK